MRAVGWIVFGIAMGSFLLGSLLTMLILGWFLQY